MANTPFFSIIIPMYNVERYIKICVDSILAQTFQDFEVIIIDDASTDNSYKLCKKLYGNNKKIRLIKQEKNAGSGAARNIGIKNARGEYIWFVDSDDAILPDALQKIFNAVQSDKNIDAIHIKGMYLTNQTDDKPIDLSKTRLHWEDNPNVGFLPDSITQRLAENWAVHRIVGNTFTTAYRRKFWVENKIYFEVKRVLPDDQIVHIACMSFAKKYLMVRDAFYIYRFYNQSWSHTPDIELGVNSMSIIINHVKNLFNKLPELSNNRLLCEKCIATMLEATLRDTTRALYDGVNISPELDQKVYETMLPIFGENTTLVKYLFHGFNTMWRQANTLAQQNHLLRDREKLLQQQKNLLEKISQLINSNENLMYQNTLLANQNKLLEQMGGLLEQHSRQLKQPQK